MAELLTNLDKRTCLCAELSAAHVGETVCVMGWAQKQRDLGALIFIDLRDRTGIVQLAFDEGTAADVMEKAKSARSEFVLAATGVVRERDSKNPNIPTGAVEVFVTELKILSAAQTPPFEIVDGCKTAEEIKNASERDHWMTAEEAKEFGLVDKIITGKK